MNAMFAKLVSMLKRDEIADIFFDMPDKTISTAAFLCVEEPDQIHKGKRRLKENYTNHWDMDYLPRQTIDELYEDKQQP
jgi:hypothetical protein